MRSLHVVAAVSEFDYNVSVCVNGPSFSHTSVDDQHSARQADVGGDAEETFPRSAEQCAAERRVEARCLQVPGGWRRAASSMFGLRLATALFPVRRAVSRRHRMHPRQHRWLLCVHLACHTTLPCTYGFTMFS